MPRIDDAFDDPDDLPPNWATILFQDPATWPLDLASCANHWATCVIGAAVRIHGEGVIRVHQSERAPLDPTLSTLGKNFMHFMVDNDTPDVPAARACYAQIQQRIAELQAEAATTRNERRHAMNGDTQ